MDSQQRPDGAAVSQSRLKQRGVALAVVVAVLAAGWAVWGKAPGTDAAKDKPRKERVAAVDVAPVLQQDMPLISHAIGRVTAVSSVAIKPRVGGLLTEALFQEGQMVKAGDVLFRLDRQPYDIALRQAEAALARDQAQLASARADAGRYGTLSEKGYASSQQRDQAQAQAQALAATVVADQAAVDMARLNLEYTEIRAPISGKTSAIRVHPGNLVTANDSASLVDVATLSPIRIAFTLAQQELPAIQRALAAGTVSAMLNDGVPATVDFLSPSVDASTGTVELRASTANEDQRLLPGEFVQVSVTLGHLKDALVVPQDAVSSGQNGQYLYVVTPEGKAELRQIQVLRSEGGLAAVAPATQPGTGVAVGEKVITEGLLNVAPGMTVKIVSGQAQPETRG